MAKISELPADLRDLGNQVPEDTFRQLHQGEAEHRLRHANNILTAAESLQAEQHRHATARARRILRAMPYKDYTEQHMKLTALKEDASRIGNFDLANAWRDALAHLESDHEQVGGTAAVGQAIMAYDKANPEEASKAAARAAALQKVIDREVAKATAEFQRKQTELRAEIEAFKLERGIK